MIAVMLIVLAVLLRLSPPARNVLRQLPTNRLLAWLRTRRGLKWGVPAMLLGAAYLAAAYGLAGLVEAGWNEVLYLPFFLCLVDAAKFLLFGPWSLLLLAAARLREAAARLRARGRATADSGREAADLTVDGAR